MADTANALANPYELIIGGSSAPFEVNLSWGSYQTTKELKSQRTGDDILDVMVTGRGLVIEATFLEFTLAQAKQYLGLGSGTAALAVGALLPAQTIQLHPVAMASDTTLDLYIYRGIFMNLRQAIGAPGELQPQVTIMAARNSSGLVWQYGPPA